MQLQMSNSDGTRLFILRALFNMRTYGAVAPSSRHLGALLARHAFVDDDSPIVELGGGTGALTRALLKAGIDSSRLYVVELDPALASYLKTAFPKIHVIQGDATELDKILPPSIVGKAFSVVSGLPLMNIPESARAKIVEQCFRVLAPEGKLLQYTYSPRSSINIKAHGLQKKRLGTILLNIPPATVWQYTRDL